MEQNINKQSDCPTWDAFVNDIFDDVPPKEKKTLITGLIQALRITIMPKNGGNSVLGDNGLNL